MCREVGDETLLREQTCPRKDVEAFGDLEEYGLIGEIRTKVVSGNDSCWQEAKGDANIFRAKEGGAEIVVFDVNCHP